VHETKIETLLKKRERDGADVTQEYKKVKTPLNDELKLFNIE